MDKEDGSAPILLLVLVIASGVLMSFRWLFIEYRGYVVPGLGVFGFLTHQTLQGKRFYAEILSVLMVLQLFVLPGHHASDWLLYLLLPLTAGYLLFSASAKRFYASRF